MPAPIRSGVRSEPDPVRRDGLLPRSFAKVSARRTPVRITVTLGVLIGLLAAVLPLSELAVNVGTLFAFVIVNAGVIILRPRSPNAERGYRVPFVPVFPLIGSALCLFLMATLEDPATTFVRFVGWLAIGILIYFAYGRPHSRLQRSEGQVGEGELA